MIPIDARFDPPAIIYNVQTGMGVGSESVRMLRKWHEEVLPHFCAPASRKDLAIRLVEPAVSLVEDAELESPPFTPEAAIEFAARGFVRKNRWAGRGGGRV